MGHGDNLADVAGHGHATGAQRHAAFARLLLQCLRPLLWVARVRIRRAAYGSRSLRTAAYRIGNAALSTDRRPPRGAASHPRRIPLLPANRRGLDGGYRARRLEEYRRRRWWVSPFDLTTSARTRLDKLVRPLGAG